MQLVDTNHGQEINQLLQRSNLLEVVTIGIIARISSIKLPIVMRHQYGISALVSLQISFCRENSCGVANCPRFLRLINWCFILCLNSKLSIVTHHSSQAFGLLHICQQNLRQQNSPFFCIVKYKQTVRQKVWSQAENGEWDWGKTRVHHEIWKEE